MELGYRRKGIRVPVYGIELPERRQSEAGIRNWVAGERQFGTGRAGVGVRVELECRNWELNCRRRIIRAPGMFATMLRTAAAYRSWLRHAQSTRHPDGRELERGHRRNIGHLLLELAHHAVDAPISVPRLPIVHSTRRAAIPDPTTPRAAPAMSGAPTRKQIRGLIIAMYGERSPRAHGWQE